MNAYLTYDRIEDRRWAEQQLDDEKEKWIGDRAKELIAMFPRDPLSMRSLFLPAAATLALTGDKALEHYNNYITRLCYDRAEEEWVRLHPTCPF